VQTAPLNVLLVEDNAAHARLIERRLGQLTPAPAVRWAATLADAIATAKAAPFDVILLDLRLADSTLDQTLPRMMAAAPELPIIVLTSLEEFDFAVKLVQQGAQDYIVKSDVSAELLSRAIYYAIERKRNQRELLRYAAELERTNRELDQFTRVVSHDLKSPLVLIQMELSALQKACRSESATWAEHIDSALDTANRMQHLIDGLLRYARFGERTVPAQDVDCSEVLRQVLCELRPTLEESRAQVTSDTLPQVWGDATRLAQVFQNLLVNAVTYHGDQPPRVHVSSEFHDPDWVFSVKDQGVGIAAEDRERVFDVFIRLHEEDVPGTGVGLSICKRVVESHGGRIWLDSALGKGTTFYFTLPARRTPAPGVPPTSAAACQ